MISIKQPCDSSRIKRIQVITKTGKALPHLGGTGKILGGILHLSITATTDTAPIDRGNWMDRDCANFSVSEIIWCRITVQNSVTANSSSLSPTGCVKSISPIHQNSMKNDYDENNNYDKSDETKFATNYSCDELQLHHKQQQVEREHAQQHAARNAQVHQ